jgi:hypothetical protein
MPKTAEFQKVDGKEGANCPPRTFFQLGTEDFVLVELSPWITGTHVHLQFLESIDGGKIV